MSDGDRRPAVTEPRTEAGRIFLAFLPNEEAGWYGNGEAIARIEAEAAEKALREASERVRAVPAVHIINRHSCTETCLHTCPRCGHEVDHRPTFHEPGCRGWEMYGGLAQAAPPPEREAMETAHEGWEAGHAEDWPKGCPVCKRAFGSSEAAPPSGLDVERLLVAMTRDAGLDALTRFNTGRYTVAELRDVIAREYAALRSPDTETGTCWFCKGTFVVDALIAGYDTFDEQRLACLACNERMQGNWRPSPDTETAESHDWRDHSSSPHHHKGDDPEPIWDHPDTETAGEAG